MLANVLRKSYFMKVVSVVLTLTFLSMNSAFAIPERDINSPIETITAKDVSVEDIGIAIDCGTIKSTFNGGNKKIIVHIQDAHCNFEAQSNINKILDQVTKECGIDMISVEGAEGIVDTAWFRAFPDAEIRKEVANYFMKKGEITGAEFFSINSDYEGTIFGAETRDYYIRNLKAFTEVYPYKDSIEKYLKNLETIANRLKTVVYTPELKELDLKIRNFDSKDLELSDFAAYLAQSAVKYKVEIKSYKDFTKLLQTLEYEQKIDFDIVDKERSDYIDALSKKLSKEDMANLVAESIKFKKGHIKSVDFYTYLRQIAKEEDIDIIHEYPNLFYYYIYTKLYEGINNEHLFKDLDAIQSALKDKLFKNDTQRKLDKYAEMVIMFVNLVNIELTNDDYDAFSTYRNEFSLEDVLKFFSNLSDRYGLGYSIDTLPGQISENLPNMVNFYEIAMKRDKALIDNTLARMQKEGKDRCVLIAGGFHTRGFKNLLEKQGVSYVVVTPKITKDVETPYIKVLTNQRTSLEDIITESAMPGVNINNSSNDMASATTKGKMLAPLAKVFFTINLLLEDEPALESISADIGELEFDYNGEMIKTTLIEAVNTGYEDMVSMLIAKWIEKQSPDNNEAVSQEEWKKLTEDDAGKKLSNALQVKMQRLSEEKPSEKMVKTVIAAFNKIFGSNSGTHGTKHISVSDSKSITDEQAINMNTAIRETLLATLPSGASYEFDFVIRGDKIGTFVVMDDDVYAANANKINKDYEKKGLGVGVPLEVECHPGTWGTWKQYQEGKITIDQVTKRFYIRKSLFEKLTPAEKETFARHEAMHIDISLKTIPITEEDVAKWGTPEKDYRDWEENYVNHQEGTDIRGIMARLGSVAHMKDLLLEDTAFGATAKSYINDETKAIGALTGKEAETRQAELDKTIKAIYTRRVNIDRTYTLLTSEAFFCLQVWI